MMHHLSPPKSNTKTGITGAAARASFFADGPPRVSWRQAELYGLVRYRTAPGTGGLVAGPASAVAVSSARSRGVRFAPSPAQQDAK